MTRLNLAPRLQPSFHGHALAWEQLQRAYHSQKMPHSWLLHGPRGIGKATVAYQFARFVLKETAVQESFLAPTVVDRQISEGVYPNLLVLERNEEGKEISVEETRKLKESLALESALPGWRVVLIDAVDEMSVQASNALLKLLEEPPSMVLFLLVAHGVGNVLPTVRSRSCRVRFSPLALSEVSPEDKPFLELTGGSLGQAWALKRGGGLALWQKVLQALVWVARGDFERLQSFAQDFGKNVKNDKSLDKIEEYETIIHLITEAVRRVILGGTEPSGSSLLQEKDREAFGVIQKLHSPQGWTEVWSTLQRFLQGAQKSHLDRVHLLMAVFFLIQNPLRGREFFYG